jgi:DNA-binding XRE family transcriptional regulator
MLSLCTIASLSRISSGRLRNSEAAGANCRIESLLVETIDHVWGTIVPYFWLWVRKDWPVRRTRQRRPSTLEQAVGQVLLEHREKQGLSQMDLAVAAGYSLRYVGDVERGTKSATMRTMNDLATFLGIRLGSLIAEAEELLLASRKLRKRRVNNGARKLRGRTT